MPEPDYEATATPHLTQEMQTILSELEQSRRAPDDVGTQGAGVYALFLAHPLQFVPAGLAYVGSSHDLGSRLVQQHFRTGGTPRSSPRRSLGALLRTELGLLPKGLGRGKFIFADSGEQDLTEWMRQHIEVGTCGVRLSRLTTIESALIRKLRPALNLTHSKNETTAKIRRLRRECAKPDKRSRAMTDYRRRTRDQGQVTAQ
jgi:hypothetical protein